MTNRSKNARQGPGVPRGAIGLALTVAIVLSIGTIAVWRSMALANERQVARIAEAESFAARSQLIRNIDTVLSTLRSVRLYWHAFGQLPAEQWIPDAAVELRQFDGIRLILWDDPARGIRFARTAQNPRLDYRPDDEEWSSYQDLLQRAREADSDSILGPFYRDNDEYVIGVVVTGHSSMQSGRLAALIDVDAMLDRLLADESPEFAVRIFDEDVEIYSRGQPADDAPDAWIREGYIRSSFDTLWFVRHLPTDVMVESFDSPGVDLTLLLGLIIAVLMGTLTFENNRARSRATAAEVAEAKLSELNRSLEEQVEKRTEQLAARTADLQTLADSVAHDLRNPLNTLSVNIELIEDELAGTANDNARDAAGRLAPCIDQMTAVLDRLLSVSAVANATFTRVPIEMRSFVRDIFEDLEATDSGPEVDFAVAELPEAMADPVLTEVLWVNVLGNALKYTKEKDQRTIRVDSFDTDAETVYRIADNGIGFDDTQAHLIFNAFTRLDDESKQDGIGLGLTLVRKVIARHEGRIWAESKPGKGATFCFTLAPPGFSTSSDDAGPSKDD